jgi:hypothetical protein
MIRMRCSIAAVVMSTQGDIGMVNMPVSISIFRPSVIFVNRLCQYMCVALIVSCCLFVGCCNCPLSDVCSWNPSPEDIHLCRQIADQYAQEELGLTSEYVKQMSVHSTGWTENGENTLWLQYYDPEHVAKEQLPLLGGYPKYFAITVTLSSKSVTDCYASPE